MRSILFRRSAAILLAAALVTGYAPVGSIADGISHAVSISASADEVVEVTTWSGLQQAVNNAENGAVKHRIYVVWPALESAGVQSFSF